MLAVGMAGGVSAIQAQGLDASPPSSCRAKPGITALVDSANGNSRVLVRFAPDVSTNSDDAYLARALGVLTADRIRQAIDVDVRSRGLGGGPQQTDASSAVAEGRVLGVRFVLVGTVRHKDDRSIVFWRLVDARSGKEVGSGSISQPTGAADSLVAVMTATLTRAFGRPPFVPPLQDRLQTRSRKALLSFLQGLAEIESFDRSALQLADSTLDAAIAADPTFIAARFRMAELSLRRLEWVEQRSAERVALVRKGLWSIGSVLLKEPRNTRALALMGRLYLHSGQPALALPIAAALEGLAPTSAEVIALRAQVLRSQGNHDQALKTLRAANAAVERDISALMVRADLERRVGDPIIACRLLNRAIVLDPTFAPAYVWRAVVRSALGERREAWSDAEVASRLGRRDWGDLTAALIDLSVADTMRVKERTARYATDASLAEGGWLDLLMRAAVAYASNRPEQAQRAVRAIDCGDPRRAQLVREPLLQALRIPPGCSETRKPLRAAT
jgi:tetratricopeptide (TPR) repeat protein